ncbi:MAG: hypothetical protein JWP87_545 [Labilithrix sp.]|nr:hypothetical protein [Labilithrix sp.]
MTIGILRSIDSGMEHADWPALALSSWEPTYLTVHRWTQIVGKVALAEKPYVNHWWHVALRVTSQGLTLSTPVGHRHLTMTFDFDVHRLVLQRNDKRIESFDLEPMSVADFYARLMAALAKLEVSAHVWPVPVEVSDTTPFTEDRSHSAYDPKSMERFHRVLLSVDRVFEIHRGRFVGKCSPIGFYWGAFDLAVTRFSGRPNPAPPDIPVMREAYSHEVISHGFWPGGDWLDKGRVEEAVFYAYAVPEPEGLPKAKIQPGGAAYAEALGEFILPYEAVRTANDPDRALLDFMESTYLAAAQLAAWDVAALRARPPRRAAAELLHASVK